ncbi:MAG TPA: winged helix-turn-helix domain-containing protein [Terriglobales bacterium]|nr:winged helix-turn-helix domain-containing protein [Terriglobales bacterium]
MPVDDTRSNGQPLRFSSFELDLRARELRKHGLRIKLQDQPFQILALLLERPGEVVTREELRDRLWPADTFVDFDHSLNSAVKKLRQALNDDPDVPRFIETLPRRGYRFIAPLSNSSLPAPSAAELAESSDGAESSAQTSAPASSATAHARHWKLWAAGTVGFALALALVAWFRPWRTGSLASAVPVRLVPLTAFSNEFSKGSFSPDGNQVAFSWDGDQPDEGIDVYVKQIGVEKPLQVTQKFGFNFFPVFSPDGRYIAFLHGSRGEVPGIFVIPALGGPPRRLIDFAPDIDCRPSLNWSPDGKFLLYADRAGDQPCSVKRLTIEDLSIRRLSFPPVPSTGDWDAQYSPDGKSIAFIHNTKDVEDIYVMPAEGGTPRRVTFDNRLLSGLAWMPDSKELIFSSNRGGSSWGLWRMPAVGGIPERLSVGSERAYFPSVSLKGNRLAYASGLWNENIWRVPVAPGHHLGKPERIIFSSMQEEGPQYSADGKHIAFQSTRSGNFEIWRSDADGTNLVQLTSFGGPLTGTPRWSPDGRQISCDTRPGPHPNIHIFSADGGPARRLPNDSSDDGVASWSHDGRWLYFASNRSGKWQVWKRTVDGGQPVQVTSDGGFAALESSNGKSIYYTKFDEGGIRQVPADGGQEIKVTDEPPKGFWGYFAVGPDGLYFLGDTGTPPKHHAGFKFFDFATRKVTALGDMEKSPFEGAPGLSVSPDGKYLLYVQLDEARNSLMMAENFH